MIYAPYAKEDVRAELVIYYRDGWFSYNAAYVRDGGIPNEGWDSLGIFPSVHAALTEGKLWWDEARERGYKKGSPSLPWCRAAA